MRTKETYFQNKEKRITHIRYTLGMSADSLISVLLLKWFAVQKKKKKPKVTSGRLYSIMP